MLRATARMCLGGAVVVAVGACGGGSSTQAPKPPDPVEMVLGAPGVRTVVIPRQRSDLTVVVPPCSAADIDPKTTRAPKGSNKIVVPRSTQQQTVAIPPCLEGQETAGGTDTVLVSPGGGAGSRSAGAKAGDPQNQLLLARNAGLAQIIVPPCRVLTSSSASSAGGPPEITTTLPAARGKTTVTAPACQVQFASSGSG
jgi:hypothetical protein